MEYKDFTKDFYEEHPEVAALTNEQVVEARKTLGTPLSLSPDSECCFLEKFLVSIP